MARYRNFDGALGAGADTQAVRPALDDVRSRRAGLKAALSALELALAAPFANRAEWVMHVRDSLNAVQDAPRWAQSSAPTAHKPLPLPPDRTKPRPDNRI